MLPVTISLGLINFNQLINSIFGSLVSDQAPAAIDKAFRIYQLPQGIFSVAVATVLFPTLARFANAGEIDNLRATMANGMRQILFVLVPAAAAILVLSDPMIRLIYQRGEFDAAQTDLVATALFWFAFSLPTNGLYLLQTRTFFSLQRPWQATGLAVIDLVVSALGRACSSTSRSGSAGIVAGTGIGTTRGGRRPGGGPAPRVRRPRVRPPVLDDGADDDRLGGAGRRSAGCLGCARRAPSAAAWRPDRLPRLRPRRSAASPTSRSRSCCGSPSWSRSPASCAAARCSDLAAICWASPRSACWPASPGSERLAFARACCPASRALRPIWRPRCWRWRCLIWVAELLGYLRAVRARALCARGRGVVGCGCLAAAGWHGEGPAECNGSARRPHREPVRTRRPEGRGRHPRSPSLIAAIAASTSPTASA